MIKEYNKQTIVIKKYIQEKELMETKEMDEKITCQENKKNENFDVN